MYKRTALSIATLTLPALLAPAIGFAKPSTDQMWALIQKQQAQIQALQQRLDQTNKKVETTEQKVAATDAKVEATGEVLASRGSNDSRWDKFHFGSYGEMHYNHLDNKKEADFHRFVLNFGYDFTDKIRFYSETELEHAISGDGQNGEVHLEQAYIDFDLNEWATARGGLFLLPVGILNQTHEPTTFFGVERNNVETNIIPTTWSEGGAAMRGDFGTGWHYEADLTTGLNVPTTGSNAYLPRKGRQNVSKAVAKDPALTAQLLWRGYPGLELGGSLQYQTDVTQGIEDNSATLFEGHAVYRHNLFGLRALYSQWNFSGSEPEAIGRDRQYGWYVEPAVYLLDDKLGLFARYASWDNNAGDSDNTDKNQLTAGVNYWPIEEVVIKADYQKQGGAADQDGFNLGIGYSVAF